MYGDKALPVSQRLSQNLVVASMLSFGENVKHTILVCTFSLALSLAQQTHAMGSADRVCLLVQKLIESKAGPKEHEEIIEEFRAQSRLLIEADFEQLAAWLTTCSNSEFYVGMKLLLTTRTRVYNAFSQDQRNVLYGVLSAEVTRSPELRRRVVSYMHWERSLVPFPSAKDRQPEQRLDQFVHYVSALVSETETNTSPEHKFLRTILAASFGYESSADEWLGRGSKFEDYLKTNKFHLSGHGIWSPNRESTGTLIASLEEIPSGERLSIPPTMESPFPGDKRLRDTIERLEL